VDASKPFEEALDRFKKEYAIKFPKMMNTKLGLINNKDLDLITELEKNLELIETDMTIFFRLLSNIHKTDQTKTALEKVNPAFYKLEDLSDRVRANWILWFEKYLTEIGKQDLSEESRKSNMNKVNPKYVLRNYMAQLAIDEADKGNYDLIDELYILLKSAYLEQPTNEKWFAKRPEWARHKIGCSMLSCSS